MKIINTVFIQLLRYLPSGPIRLFDVLSDRSLRLRVLTTNLPSYLFASRWVILPYLSCFIALIQFSSRHWPLGLALTFLSYTFSIFARRKDSIWNFHFMQGRRDLIKSKFLEQDINVHTHKLFRKNKIRKLGKIEKV